MNGYQAIYLHLKGTSMAAIADILNRNRMTVSSYISYVRERWTGALQIAILPQVLLLG
ncbi:hypothetical protein P7H17_19350 [Paenibacillus larvae]|nr:hypothetical protein [Paenibacillus larvae]MDT2287781.1 hypothetical protein [Paenibacillus larvae]